jgi:hypothetical protein
MSGGLTRYTRLKPVLDKITRDKYSTIDISDLHEAALIKIVFGRIELELLQ